jgi:hypothetical protein
MLSLDALERVYPDARFVMTHRDPARVLASVCSLIRLMYRMSSDADDPVALGREQLELWALALERAIRFRARAGEARFADASFEELRSDPVGCVERLYARLGLPWRAGARERMREWAAEHAAGRHGEHVYRLADFGLDAARVRERFAPYLERFGVALEQAA